MRERREGDAANAEFFERGEQAFLNPAIEHGVGRLVNEQRDAHALENLRGLARAVGTVRGDADVERLALMHGGDQRAHGLFERAIVPGAVRVKDVDVVEAHALEAVVERGEQIFARAADAVGAGPHVPAGLCGDDEFVAQPRNADKSLRRILPKFSSAEP